MRCLVLSAVVLAMTAARPETYREKEDFQYSRSSSDEGSKSGYYGAQRGNMGGNYERAHNMDGLAQHQMSGLIHQVDGELGDASNTKTGSVFTASNSRGIYGSGHYDLSNLDGRNFQEGMSNGNSNSQSALTNSAYRDHSSNEKRYSNSNSYSHSSRHSNSERSEYEQREGIQSSNLRSGDSTHQQEYGTYDGSSRLSQSASPYQNRLISTKPMRILVRPGTRVSIPLATQTYDADHSASTYDSSAYNQHAAKSDAEVIANSAQESHNRHVPANKHYESSYSYQKEWEKHNSSPGAVPLGIDIDHSIPKTSELYDDSQQSQGYNSRNQQYTSNTAGSHNRHSSNSYDYNTKSNLASSSHSKQQSEYDMQREKSSSDYNAINSNAHQTNFDANFANQQGTTNSKQPKSYESSYSYHKSWERQGDPYVIVPVPGDHNGQASQRLTGTNSHDGYSSHQYGSKHKSSHQSYSSSNGLMDCDCDEDGHIRVARSYNMDQEVQQQQNGWEYDDQHSQSSDQNQWDQIQDLGQQTQNNWDKPDDVGQQTQSQWDKIEDLGQHSQNEWDKSENSRQQTQNQWDKIEDPGQQTQNKWEKSEDFGQQTQNQWDKIEDPGQQTQNKWEKSKDFGQQTQNQWDKIEDLGQQTQSKWDKIEDVGQQSQNERDKFEDFSLRNRENQIQQSQSVDRGQATWRNVEKSHIQSDTKKYESQEASVSLFEDKNTVIFPSQSMLRETSTTTNVPQDSYSIYGNLNNLQSSAEHFYDNENKHFHETLHKDQSLSNTNINTISDGETHNNDKQTGLNKKQTVNNYLHQQVTENTISDTVTQHESSINNLWDKLDRLDRDSSLNNFKNTAKYHSLDNDHRISHTTKITTTESSKDSDKIPRRPKDIGRGDIETEDTNFELNTNFNVNDTDTKEYRPTQIEALSLSTNQNNITNTPHDSFDKKHFGYFNTSLDSIHQKSEDLNKGDKKIKHHKDELNLHKNVDQGSLNYDFMHNDSQNNHNAINKVPDHQFETPEEINEEQHLNKNYIDYSKPKENSDLQSMYHFDFINQQNNKFDQQNMQQSSQFFNEASHNFEQHNLNQKHEDIGPLNENFDQENIHHNFQYPDHQYTNQNNVQQNVENFDKSTMDQQQFGQGIADYIFEQGNMEQYLQRFDKPRENFDQKNSNEQLVNFSKLNENFDQKSVNHQFETFDEQNENLDQNIDQNLQVFDKSIDNFDQENLNQNQVDFSNINDNNDQLSINKHNEGFHQESESTDQENMEIIMENFGKNSILDQHNTNQNFDYEKRNENFEVGISRENFDQKDPESNFAQEIKNSNQNKRQDESNSEHSVTDIYEDKENVANESLLQQSPHLHSPTTVAPVLERTGFWASVGNKFSKAKDKVSSWFQKTSK